MDWTTFREAYDPVEIGETIHVRREVHEAAQRLKSEAGQNGINDWDLSLAYLSAAGFKRDADEIRFWSEVYAFVGQVWQAPAGTPVSIIDPAEDRRQMALPFPMPRPRF